MLRPPCRAAPWPVLLTAYVAASMPPARRPKVGSSKNVAIRAGLTAPNECESYCPPLPPMQVLLPLGEIHVDLIALG